MSDYTELQKAAAYAAQDTIKFADEDEEMRALQQFHEEVDPEAVLALIAENDQLKKDRRTEHQSLRSDKARNSLYMMIATSMIDDHPYERTGSDWDYEHPIHDKIISFLAERDQLKAENEALRKDAERYRWLRDSDCSGKILRDMGAKYRADADQRIDAAMGQGEQA